MQSKEDIINDILSDVPEDTEVQVYLPSRNKVYDLEEDHVLTLRPMTFEDEKQLISAKTEDPINLLLDRCLDGISVTKLLSFDKLYLIMKLREISYGDEYETLLACSHCSTENPTTIKLSELLVHEVPDEFTEPVIVKLPKAKKEVNVRLPRVSDEKLLANAEDSLDGLWRFVESIDGHTDKAIIAEVLNKLPLVDIKTILSAFNLDFGVDTKVKLKCKSCGGVSIIDLPITANFFGVS